MRSNRPKFILRPQSIKDQNGKPKYNHCKSYFCTSGSTMCLAPIFILRALECGKRGFKNVLFSGK